MGKTCIPVEKFLTGLFRVIVSVFPTNKTLKKKYIYEVYFFYIIMIRKDYSVQYVRNYLHDLLTSLHLRMDQNVIFSQWIASGRIIMFLLYLKVLNEWLVI